MERNAYFQEKEENQIMEEKYIDIDAIRVSPFNVRQSYAFPSDFSKLKGKDKAFARSVREQGILHAITVRRVEGAEGYECVIGQRRLLAAKVAKLKKVRCVVEEYNDLEAILASLSENIHRKDIDPIARAQAIKQLLEMAKPRQVAKKLGLPKSTLSEWVKVTELCSDVQDMLRVGEISYRAALKLAQKNLLPAEQIHLAKIATESMKDFYRELRKRKRDYKGVPIEEAAKETEITAETPEVAEGTPAQAEEEPKVPLPETPVEIRFKIQYGQYKTLMGLAEANGFGTDNHSVPNFVRQLTLDYITVATTEGETEEAEAVAEVAAEAPAA